MPHYNSRADLKKVCRQVRRDILTMTWHAQSGHTGGAFSCVETLVALYAAGFLRHDAKNPLWEERDRLIFSKGHACAALYSVLARCGYFPLKELATFRQFHSRLQGHPLSQDHPFGTPGVEMPSGSLGKGLSFGIGQALALKLGGNKQSRVVVILSDGELQEGETKEAIHSAGKDWGRTKGILGDAVYGKSLYLDNLMVFVDANGYQNDGSVRGTCPGDPSDMFPRSDWHVYECADGNDIGRVMNTLWYVSKATRTRPTVIILRTRKGAGVSFIERDNKFHGTPPNDEEYKLALGELGFDGPPAWLPQKRSRGSTQMRTQINTNICENPRFDRRKSAAGQLFAREAGTRDAVGDALVALGEERDDIVVIAADLAKSTGAEKFARRFPDRFFNVGIQEQNAVVVAAGLAAMGKTVFVLTFADFQLLGLEPFRQQVVIPGCSVKLIGSHAGLTVGKDGVSAQSLSDIAMFRALEGDVVVAVPADYNETLAIMVAAAKDPRPWYIRTAREKFPIIYQRTPVFIPGRADIFLMRKDTTIIACGLATSFAFQAAQELSPKYRVGVINMSSIKPIDEIAIRAAVMTSEALVIAEEHSAIGGLGSAVFEVLAHEGISIPVAHVAIPEGLFFGSGTPDELLTHAGFMPHALAQAVQKLVRKYPTDR